jgi:predicted component of type VI protein secretion system
VRRRDNESITLGRELGCGLTVADHLASRRHCTIERRQDKWVLKDHSRNGTFVTTEGDLEIMLQREEMMLRRRGWISLGHPREEGGEAVEYSCD